ncbi:MAG TPA: hypothetical protein VME63_02420 [Dyella sp.]|uniref:hypothetical protein n=1 Tax=Dyella sp. TaxID=1869338 RepID=UPI002CDB68FC|nr:hypothetical protein [Dyella sp.]HTV84229.1 hypothetical protein [Dyella sp.]
MQQPLLPVGRAPAQQPRGALHIPPVLGDLCGQGRGGRRVRLRHAIDDGSIRGLGDPEVRAHLVDVGVGTVEYKK